MAGIPRGHRGNRYQDSDGNALSGIDYPQQKGSPFQRESIDFHLNDDVDGSWKSHHHTLGNSPGQAASGMEFFNHTHDGTDSQPVLATYPYVFRATGSASVASGAISVFALIPIQTLVPGSSYNGTLSDVNGSGEFVTPFEGIWNFTVGIQYPANATGGRGVGFLFSGAAPGNGSMDEVPSGSTIRTILNVTTPLWRAAGARVGVGVWQNSGVALNPTTFTFAAACLNRTA